MAGERPQTATISEIITDLSFPLAAATEATTIPPLYTAQTAMGVGLEWNGTDDQDTLSRRYYPTHYGRIGVLKALQEEGVVCIPASDRYLLSEMFHEGGKHEVVGRSIIDFFKDFSSRKRNRP